jgi:transposase
MQDVPFQAQGHRISCELLNYTRDLLAYGFTNKQVAYLTGLGKNTVKDIDLQRLKEKYTVDGERLIQPERQARFLGIDEFKLHDGHKYAVIIIDMETGHILWLAHGKKKASVYSFIEHVGKDWMDGVEAVACDMNSDFQEAFEDRCPHIQTVFDYFHIVKNFNDKVVGQIRKDEQRRLIAEGDEKAAKSLKGSRYILTSSKQTLARKDQEAEDGKILSKGSSLFSKEQVVRKDGHLARYEDLIRQNKLLFTLDLIKEKLCEAYKMTDEPSMAGAITEIMDMCMATGNKHLLWFSRLLDNHFEGIIAHATYDISAGKIEGINNKIKTLRRQGYGYPDDDYFFLKLFDASRGTFDECALRRPRFICLRFSWSRLYPRSTYALFFP